MEFLGIGSLFILFLIYLLPVIVFFVMGANIGAIKRRLESLENKIPTGKIINYTKAFEAGELNEYLGRKHEALDSYMEAYYLLHKFSKKNPKDANIKTHKDLIENKIKSMGGIVKEIL